MSFRCLYKWILILLLGSYRARIVHCTGGSGESPATSSDQTALFSLGSGSTSQDTPSSPPSQSTNLTGSTNATTGTSVHDDSSDDEPGLPPALKALAAKCEIITQTGVTFETHKGEDCATKLDDKTLKFELPGINCVEFRFDDQSVWKYDSSLGEKYPESIKLTSKTVEICYSDSSIKYPLSDAESELLPAPSTETSAKKSEPLSLPTESPTILSPIPETIIQESESENQTSENLPSVTFTVVTVESVYGKNPKENDATKYEVKEDNDFLEYRFKDGAYCVELKAGDCSIWIHSLSKEGIELPKIITINKANYDVTVRFENFLTYFYKHKLVDDKSTWTLDEETGLNEFYVSKLKLLVVDQSDPKKTKDLHKTLYEMTCDGDLCYYELKPGSYCSRIDYDGEPVWRYSLSDHGFPKSLSFDASLKLLLMEFEKVTCAYSLLVDGSPLIIPKPDSIATVLSIDNLQVKTQDPNDASVSKINDKTMYDLKTVGGSKPFSKIYFKPEAKCDMVGYKHENPCGNDECLNKKLKYNYVPIWQHDKELHGDMYPKAVYLISLNNTVTVWFGDEWFYAYKFTSKGWHLELESTEGKPKILKINQVPTSNTIQLEPLKSVQPPKSDVLDSLSSLKSEATKFNLMKSELVKFEEPEAMDLLTLQEFDPTLVKLMVADNENSANLRENDKTMYDVRSYKNGRTFKFRTGKFCHEVKYKNKTVWKYDASLHRGHFPTQVDLDLEEPEMIRVVLADDWYYIYEYEKGDFVLKETMEPAVPIVVQKEPKSSELISESGDILEESPAPLAPEYENPEDEEIPESQPVVVAEEVSPELSGEPAPISSEPSTPKESTSTKSIVTPLLAISASDIPVGLKIFTVKISDPDFIMENYVSTFDLEKYGPVFACTFKPGFKCTEVKYDGNVVWNCDSLGSEGYSPKALYFDEAKPPMFRVFFKNDWNYTYKFDGTNWVLKYSITTGIPLKNEKTDVGDDPSAAISRTASTTKYRDLQLQIRSYLRSDLPEPETPKLTDRILIPFKKHPAEINIYTVQNGNAVLNIDDETLYEVKRGTSGGNVFKYAFNHRVKCSKLMYGYTQVWKHNRLEHGDSYPTTAYYVRDIKMVTVVFSDKWFYTYQYINHKFELTEYVKSENGVMMAKLVELKKDYEEAQKRLKEIKEALATKKAELAENRSTSSDKPMF